ncbi:MAG TPA: hypothetical protein VGO16_09640 [Pseudonocardiaceae bacterium]|nr:hypothetical protein [Pseudonocardiaceae bacterium]
MKELRKWSGLTLKELEDRHDILKVSTTSDYLRGVRWPCWEWVHAFVTACLTHRGLTDPVRIQAELAHRRTAWGYVEHQRTGQGQPPQTPGPADAAEASTPDATGGVQSGIGDQEEDVEGPTRLRRTVQPEPRQKQSPVAMTVGGDSDPATRNASTEGAGKQLDQAAATPHGERHPLPRRVYVIAGGRSVEPPLSSSRLVSS